MRNSLIKGKKFVVSASSKRSCDSFCPVGKLVQSPTPSPSHSDFLNSRCIVEPRSNPTALQKPLRLSHAPAATINLLMERTLIILKPDAVQRGLVGEIITRFEKKGLQVVGVKLMKIPAVSWPRRITSRTTASRFTPGWCGS